VDGVRFEQPGLGMPGRLGRGELVRGVPWVGVVVGVHDDAVLARPGPGSPDVRDVSGDLLARPGVDDGLSAVLDPALGRSVPWVVLLMLGIVRRGVLASGVAGHGCGIGPGVGVRLVGGWLREPALMVAV
jgi:hypothetical protein